MIRVKSPFDFAKADIIASAAKTPWRETVDFGYTCELEYNAETCARLEFRACGTEVQDGEDDRRPCRGKALYCMGVHILSLNSEKLCE